MSKTSTFNAGRNWAQSGGAMPKMTGWSNTAKQTFGAGFAHGSKK
ncbi:hypothetical protein [Roseobacter sp. MH60115]|nr:hypothetical protein [Roseobacter sp. MH60115]